MIGGHLETFLRAAAEAGGGDGLPQFVERELREFLGVGIRSVGLPPDAPKGNFQAGEHHA